MVVNKRPCFGDRLRRLCKEDLVGGDVCLIESSQEPVKRFERAARLQCSHPPAQRKDLRCPGLHRSVMVEISARHGYKELSGELCKVFPELTHTLRLSPWRLQILLPARIMSRVPAIQF